MSAPGPVRRLQESRTPEQLAALLVNLSADDERELRAYLGNDRFRRLRERAQSLGTSRALRPVEGHVVVLPGVMGSEITVSDAAQNQSLVWLSALRLYAGWLGRLRLDADGKNPFEPAYRGFATNVLVKYYGELTLALSRRWNARAFWYDWRRSLDGAAAELETFLRREDFQGEPVVLVAHSMGGLVARSLLLKAPRTATGDPLVKRLVMLGTPNHGSFEVPQIFAGIQDTVRQLIKLTGGLTGLVSAGPARKRLLEIVSSFPALYQMMPWPEKVPDDPKQAARLYDAATYAAFNAGIAPEHLRAAAEHHRRLAASPADGTDLVYVAGYGEPTVVGLRSADDLRDPAGYLVTADGDGRVPHALGLLDGVPTYFVRCAHGDLARNAEVLGAIDDLVKDGRTLKLSDRLPAGRGAATDPAALHRLWAARFGPQEQAREDAELGELARRLSRRADVNRGADGVAEPPDGRAHGDDRALEERLMRPFLGGPEAAPAPEAPTDVPEIVVRLACADIGACQQMVTEPIPVDAVAGGFYQGVRPTGAVHALDRSLGEALPHVTTADGRTEPRLLLTELIQRGTIRGDLGAPFLLPDPREGGAGRVIALAGLGVPGRCGVPELALTIRELCWALNGLGKRHLATLLIGSGEGNLSIPEALEGLLCGIARALCGTRCEGSAGVPRSLQCVTIVEYDAERLLPIAVALEAARDQLRDEGRLRVRYQLTDADRRLYRVKALDGRVRALARRKKELDEEKRLLKEKSATGAAPAAGARPEAEPAPARVTFALEDGVCVFGAVTNEASIPERTVEVDTLLVEQANDRLVAADTEAEQRRHGAVLGRLLIPDDLRDRFGPGVPLVLQLNARSARVHWEMVVCEEGGSRPFDPAAGAFLGLARGLTRQLRTAFAPPPEPPPAARRVLQVLVVADPAADARLDGALEEAAEVANLFEALNRVYESEVRADVVRLFGPGEATRVDVLAELCQRPFDVLHYAGHGFFDPRNPAGSGWVFRADPPQVLSARELRRARHVPRFVFANACESGVTPDRPEDRHAALVPSFAEAFFERGVADFVCTAWPVDDGAARVFARCLYAGLLGLRVGGGAELEVLGPREPLPMYRALKEARVAAAAAPGGRRTWGAYQHYGNPHARFFADSAVGHAREHFAVV